MSILQKVFDACETPCQASRILLKELFDPNQTRHDWQVFQRWRAWRFRAKDISSERISNEFYEYHDSSKPNQSNIEGSPHHCVISTQIGQSSLSNLRSDKSLDPLGIKLEIGLPKNINKNAVVDKAIREHREQVLKLSPKGGPVSPAILARATASLKLLIQQSSRSAKELWLSSDQESDMNLEVKDEDLSNSQFQSRQASHASSASYSSRNGKPVNIPTLAVGDSVFVKTDRSKSKARDSFYILELDELGPSLCQLPLKLESSSSSTNRY